MFVFLPGGQKRWKGSQGSAAIGFSQVRGCTRRIHLLMLAAGFEHRWGGRNHMIYRHSRLDGYQLSVKQGRPLLPTYVSQAIRAIDEVLAQEAEGE